MATTTTNYKLTKPDKKEKINVGVINQNMDVIDTNLKSISDKVGDAEKNIIVGIQKNGTDLSVNSSTRKVNVTVPTKVSQLENDLGFKTTDNNTTYGVATSSTLGLVKSGADITVDSSGNVSVNDDSHNHTIANIDGLQEVLDSLPTNIPTLVAGNNITLTPNTSTNEITISSTGGGSGTVGSLTDLGVTATADELNYVDGVTSNIQTQLNGKANSSHGHSDKLPVSTTTATYTTLADFWTHCDSVFKSTNSRIMMGRAKLTTFTPLDGWFRYIVSAQNTLGNGEWAITGSIILDNGTSVYYGIVSGGITDSSDLVINWKNLGGSSYCGATIYNTTEPTSGLTNGLIWIG